MKRVFLGFVVDEPEQLPLGSDRAKRADLAFVVIDFVVRVIPAPNLVGVVVAQVIARGEDLIVDEGGIRAPTNKGPLEAVRGCNGREISRS